MVLNYIWIAFFFVAFLIALVRLVFLGDTEVFPAMMNSTFDQSRSAFEISIGLTGMLALWLGVMKVGERAGLVNVLARVLSPVFTKLFPDIPKGHPATGSIFMNIAANMLGLDNAATPLGLKAMEQLQTLNPKKDTATNPMIMFLVLNKSVIDIDLLPPTRKDEAHDDGHQHHGGHACAHHPNLVGRQLHEAPHHRRKEDTQTAHKQQERAMDALIDGIKWCVSACGFSAAWVDGLPTALMKPLSGSGARGMMLDAMKEFGADSFAGRLSCLFQGSTDTTFYILAVYFGSIGVRYTRHAVACGLLADLAGVIAAIAIAYMFFG